MIAVFAFTDFCTLHMVVLESGTHDKSKKLIIELVSCLKSVKTHKLCNGYCFVR